LLNSRGYGKTVCKRQWHLGQTGSYGEFAQFYGETVCKRKWSLGLSYGSYGDFGEFAQFYGKTV